MSKSSVETPGWLIEPLRRSHDRGAFDCGSAPLNDFIRTLARQQQARHVGKTFVAVERPGAKQVLGYYTVSAGSIRFEHLPAEAQKRVPRYPVPVARLGRLAVDRSIQGKGLGAALLRDALLRIAKVASTDLGIVGVVVDAKDDGARRFYERCGFVLLADHPLTLIILTRSILAALPETK